MSLLSEITADLLNGVVAGQPLSANEPVAEPVLGTTDEPIFPLTAFERRQYEERAEWETVCSHAFMPDEAEWGWYDPIEVRKFPA